MKVGGVYAILPSICTQISYLVAIFMIFFKGSNSLAALIIVLVGATLGVILLMNSPLNQPPEEYKID
jgi:hypothetical protein